LQKNAATLPKLDAALLENPNQTAAGGEVNRMQRIATARMCMHGVLGDAQMRGSKRTIALCVYVAHTLLL
jgi:hypothetical protein